MGGTSPAAVVGTALGTILANGSNKATLIGTAGARDPKPLGVVAIVPMRGMTLAGGVRLACGEHEHGGEKTKGNCP
jgi:hypothetical protein